MPFIYMTPKQWEIYLWLLKGGETVTKTTKKTKTKTKKKTVKK